MRKPILVLVLSLFATLWLAACGDDDAAPSAGDGVTAVTRQLFATAPSERAPGQELVLSRVIVPAGAELAPHTHPGTQMAYIAEGTLTYTVYSDQAVVTRGAATASARAETIAAGTTTKLATGDSIVEPAGMKHSAKNEGSSPVVIYLSSLFEAGAPASSPADVN